MRARSLGAIIFLFAFAPRAGAAEPISWKGSDREAVEAAQAVHKPILLFMSPAWSTWGQRMEHDTFRDPRAAAAVSGHAVPIRLDPDLRPDIATRFLRRGWPITAFLTETGVEISSAESLDADRLVALLDSLAKVYDAKKAAAARPAESAAEPGASAPGNEAQLLTLVEEWHKKEHDRKHGGFGTGTKLLPVESLEFALIEADAAANAEFDRMASKTLDGLLKGAIHDSAGGGFYHAARERDWSGPTRAKLLEDQARMAQTLLAAEQLGGRPEYADAAKSALRYALARLWSEKDGLFRQGQVWPESDPKKPATRPSLLHPFLTGANLETARALLYAHSQSVDPTFLDRARCVVKTVSAQGRLKDGGIAREIQGGRPSGITYLEDQVIFAVTLLDLAEATHRIEPLDEAANFVGTDLALFKDGPLYADVPAARRTPLARDTRYPLAENARIVVLLRRLADLTGVSEHREAADALQSQLVKQASAVAGRPRARATQYGLPIVGSALILAKREPFHITLVGPAGSTEAAKLFEAGHSWPNSTTYLQWLDPKTDRARVERLGYDPDTPEPTAYVCQGLVCLTAARDPDKLRSLRNELTRRRSAIGSAP
ncbi:MAG: thioredoxin domain-containing protein [Nitrospirae bacterium]|nr:thioredoxin domain-containing protein [Nitrospirota bacterium]